MAFRDKEIADKFFKKKERKLKVLANLISQYLLAPNVIHKEKIDSLGMEIENMDLITELKFVYDNNIDGKIGREILNRENKLDEIVRGDLWYYKINRIEFEYNRIAGLESKTEC